MERNESSRRTTNSFLHVCGRCLAVCVVLAVSMALELCVSARLRVLHDANLGGL